MINLMINKINPCLSLSWQGFIFLKSLTLTNKYTVIKTISYMTKR